MLLSLLPAADLTQVHALHDEVIKRIIEFRVQRFVIDLDFFQLDDFIQDQATFEALLRHGFHFIFDELFARGIAHLEISIEVHALLREAIGKLVEDVFTFMLKGVLVILDGHTFLEFLDQVHEVFVVVFVL